MKCTFSEYREQWAVLVIFVAGMVTFLHRNNRRSASADLRKGAIKGSVAERGKLWPVLLAFAALAAAEVTYAATYNLPADLNKGAFLAGSCNTSTYVCPGNVDFGNDNDVDLNVTTSFTLRINGNFVVKNNLCVYDLPGILSFDVGGNFVAAQNTGQGCEFTANITAGGNISLGNNTSVTGNVNAGGNLSVGSGTIDGYCGYDTTNFIT